MTFEALALAGPLARALTDRAYTTPTPIQVQALPPQLAGRDLLALAETGSGKTAAFVLPILDQFAKAPASPNTREALTLVLAPTRELALQIDGEIAALAKHMPIRRAVVLGGVGKFPQINALKRGVHILVATPGRLLDLVSERHCDLRTVRTLVIDEADRMFDMGFIRDVRKIVSMLSHKRRTAMFSATMPEEIRTLATELLNDAARVDLSPKRIVVDRIDQSVMVVRASDKQSRLHTILQDTSASRVIVFTRTKRGADRVADRLAMAGFGAAAIHGNKAQNARQRALADFSAGHVRVLVATDIAARGIDVSNVTHVINFDMPMEPETYVHRIGRTARKGESGIAISLCDPAERAEIAAIEKLMKQKITVIDDVGGEPVAMPERRPHHTHSAPRREGAHRKGPANGGGRQGKGEHRVRGEREDRRTRDAARDGDQRGKRHGAPRNGAPRDGAPRDGGNRPEHRDQEQRHQQRRGGVDRHHNGRPPQSEAGSRPWAPQDAEPRNDNRGPHGEGRNQDRKPAHAKAHHGNTHHGKAHPARRDGENSFGGQQPPKFMKQRGHTPSFPRPNGKPAA